MKLLSKLTVLLSVLFVLTSNSWALQPNQELNEEGKVVESFYASSDDLLAISSSPDQFLRPFPITVQPLFEPSMVGSLAIIAKIRNSFNEVVGSASELEHITVNEAGQTTGNVNWTLKIPNRGSLAATQIEDFTSIIAVLMDMVANGEAERYLDPPLLLTTTIPDTGKIIGGTGEFAGKTGTFKEINEIYYLSLATGSIGVNITLEVTYDDNQDDNQ